MITPYTIYPAQAQDREGIISILTSVTLPTEDLPQSLNTFLVSKEQGKITGTAGLELYGNYALLRSLAVASDKQGMGLGKALYEEVMQLASRNGVKQVYLITTTAAAFFEKRGFGTAGRSTVPPAIQRTAQFTRICPSSATIMRRTI